MTGHFKDAILDRLARDANVAQFVSFDPRLRQRFAWLRDRESNLPFASPLNAVDTLLVRSPEHSVNIRSFEPDAPKSREFIYGCTTTDRAIGELTRLASHGLYTIVNETVDVADGGVSGVAFGDVVEFAPGDTPRCVEKSGTAALERGMAFELLQTVYGFAPELHVDRRLRVEFSVHPLRRGYRHSHTIVWEIEEVAPPPVAPETVWPNLFSRLIGDKAFGLLVAHVNGLPVPRTDVFARAVAPFRFGRETGSGEIWIRTCPIEQDPGRFTTQRGWRDPFRLLQDEDPNGVRLASVLAQEGVDAVASGALLTTRDGTPLIEGVSGTGEEFMVGRRAAETLAPHVVRAVRELFESAAGKLGGVRFEWVFDGRRAWVVQLHRGVSESSDRTVVHGEAPRFHHFDVKDGLEALRKLVHHIKSDAPRDGIVLVGSVGVTSHFGDILRRAAIPSRIESAAVESTHEH